MWIKTVTFDCADALVVANFWAAALGTDVDEESTSDKAYVEAPGWGGPNMWFNRVPEPKTARIASILTCTRRVRSPTRSRGSRRSAPRSSGPVTTSP